MSNIGPRETFLGPAEQRDILGAGRAWPVSSPSRAGGSGRRSVRASCCDAGTTYRDRPVW